MSEGRGSSQAAGLEVREQAGRRVHAQLAHGAALLGTDGLLAATQALGNHADAEPRTDQAQHFHFPGRQLIELLRTVVTNVEQLPDRGRHERSLATVVNGFWQVIEQPALAHQAANVQLQQLAGQCRVIEHGDHDYCHVGVVPAQSLNQPQPIHLVVAGHVQVGDQQLAGLLVQHVKQRFHALRLADNLECALASQYGAHAHQGDWVVVGYHYAQGHDRTVLSGSGWPQAGVTGEG